MSVEMLVSLTPAQKGPAMTGEVTVELGGIARVAAKGELDLATAGSFRDRLFELIDGGCARVLLDLAALDFCDSQGLRALVEAADRAEAAGGRVTLTGTQPQLARILLATHLDGRFGTATTKP